jgi:hypothetical protein
MAENNLFATTGNDGSDSELDPDVLRDIQTKILTMSQRNAWWSQQRYLNTVIRFNQYTDDDGWNSDMRWHHLGIKKGPLTRSSDQISWLCDEICNEKVSDAITAMRRAIIRCEPRGLFKDAKDRSDRWTVILKWLVDRMGSHWINEHSKALNYMVTDSPAVSLMRVDWRKEESMVMKKLTAEEIAEQWAQEYLENAQEQGAQVDQNTVLQAQQSFLSLLSSPDTNVDDLVSTIMQFFPRIKAKRAKKAAAEILKSGAAEFPVQTVVYEGPRLTATRFGDDFYCPDSMTEFRSCPIWVVSEWLFEADLRNRAKEEDWDEDFLKEVLANESMAAFDDYAPTANGWASINNEVYRAGQYQILWVYRIANNDDGIKSRYVSVIHPRSTKTAFGQKMIRFSQNHWPAVLFCREYMAQGILWSRGVPEISGKDQSLLKRMRDMVVDNADVGHLPPIVSIRGPSSGNIALKSMKHVNLPNASSSLAFMQPPQPPATCLQVQKDVQSDVARYYCRPSELVTPEMVQRRQEFEIGLVLDTVRDELQIILELARTYMSQDMLNMILGDEASTKAVTIEELSGDFEVKIDFDTAELSTKNMLEAAEIFQKYIAPMNGGKTIDSTILSEQMLRGVLPNTAQRMITSKAEGTSKEIEDEQKNYMILRAGGMPQMNTSGSWNYQARIGMYQQMLQANPQVFSDMAPDKLQNLKGWMDGLAHQSEQFGKNANEGRTGVKDTAAMPMTAGGLQ